MSKVGRPAGLIRYASFNSIERGEPFRFTARVAWYLVVLIALASLLGFLVFTRSVVETMLLRAPGALYQATSEGRISNLYTLKGVNKSGNDLPIQLQLEGNSGQIKLMGTGALVVPGQDLAQTSVLIEMDRSELAGPKTKLKIGVYSDGKRLETINTAFAGPRN
jgi:polyferredoxin